MPPATRRALILILLAGAALRFVPIWFGLPYPQARPDEEVATGIALKILEGDLNPHFFHWPSLTFYLFAAVFGAADGLLGSFGDDGSMTFSEHALLARGTIALCGTITLFVLFRAGRMIAGDLVGLLAAAFLAVALLHVRDSHFAMTDVLMTFLLWTSLTLLVGAALAAQPSTSVCALAGLAGGLATSTKYNAGAVAIAMLATQIIWIWRQPSAAFRWRTWIPIVVFATVFLLSFIAGTPYAVLDYPKFSEDLRFDFTHLSGGHNDIYLGRGWIYHATHSLPFGAGITTCAAALVGLWPFVRRHGRAAIVLGSFAVPFYAAVGSGYTVFFRYVLPLIPLICLLAAFGVVAASRWLAGRTRVAYGPAVSMVCVLAIGPGLVYAVWFDVLLARTDTRVLAGEWITPRLTDGATLHDSGGPYTRLDLWRSRVTKPPYDPDRHVFPEGQLPEWLVLQSSMLESYASTPTALATLARERYVRVYRAQGRQPGRTAVYDLQDAFFLPFNGFEDVVRPGPTITIYRRADLPRLPEDH